MPRRPFRVDFFCIGAPRCGTTWFLQCLDEHPGITIANPKEPNHFVRYDRCFEDRENPDYLRDQAAYRACFDAAGPDDLLGDGSVTLLSNTDTAPGLLHAHNPDAKLLVLLRDPVARTYSNYWHDRTWSDPGLVPDRFEDALRNERLVARSRYHEQLAAWAEVFPREAFHVVLDLDLKADRTAAFRDTFRFLGVEPDFVPPSLDARLNAPAGSRGLLDMGYRAGTAARRLGLGKVVDWTKSRGAESALARADRVAVDVPPIHPDTAARLRARLLPDLEALEPWLGRDLTAWKEGR